MLQMFFVMGVTVAAVFSTPAHAQVVSFQGVGPVRLGMTISAAERALMVPLLPKDSVSSENCWITQRSDGKDAWLSYVVQKGKIVMIDIASRDAQGASLTDTRGIGIGGTEADIRRAYPQVQIARAPYYDEESEIEAAKTRAKLGVKAPEQSPHYWAQVDSPNHERAIIFDTQDGRITTIKTGFKPVVTDPEVCVP